MAGTLTHASIGEKVIKKMDFPINKDLYLLSCQGHDLLFFIRLYEFPIFKKRKKMIKRLQNEDFPKVIKLMEEEVQKTGDADLKSFMYGYITHHITDSIMHPFIIYETGEYDGSVLTRKYQGKHALLESIIDVKVTGDVSKISIPTVKKNKILERKLNNIFESVYNEPKIGSIMVNNLNNVRHFIKLYRIDKTKLKRRVYKLVSTILHEKYEYISYNYTSDELNIDLNQVHTWHHPVTNQINQTSINDLIEKSIDDSLKIINDIEKNLNNNKLSEINLDISAVHGGKTNTPYTLKHFKN